MEESVIVAEVTFGESSSGAAIAHGKNVPAGGDRAGAGGYESREQVIANGKQRIHEVSISMRLPPKVEEEARRHFNVCVAINFIKGRSSKQVAAACLYITCRQNETSHMLIDFSDKLRINVFELGATYTKLVRSLHLEKQVPLVDPAHYIRRFAALLEFGEEEAKVAEDATRLVRRFKNDWLHLGRRPSGICGAALLLAARMNNFRRSVEEIMQVVKISDCTIQKRLSEFVNTPSGELTIQDFRTVWLEQNADPPAYTRGLEKRRRVEEAAAVYAGVGQHDPEGDADDEEDAEISRPHKRRKGLLGTRVPDSSQSQKTINHSRQSSVALSESALNILPAGDEEDYELIEREIEQHVKEGEEMLDKIRNGDLDEESINHPSDSAPLDGTAVEGAEEPFQSTNNTAIDQPPEDDVQPDSAAQAVDSFEDLDDDEISGYLCTSDETARKMKLWFEFNKEYLEEKAGSLAQSLPLLAHAGTHMEVSAIAKNQDKEDGVERKRKVRAICFLFNCPIVSPSASLAVQTFQAERLLKSHGLDSS
ncbi:cyclin-like protein [Clavulina sp. PMI_390]|nr:cyclin-like protein [Clavulina sp. PMI_390]